MKQFLCWVIIIILLAGLAGLYVPRGGSRVLAAENSYSLNILLDSDSYISSANPTSNYGLYSTIYINDNPSNRQRAVLEADIQSQIPSSATITGLTLYMYYYSYSGSDPSGYALYVKKLAQPFVETGVTWNTYDGNNNWPGGPGAMGDTTGDPVNITGGTIGSTGWKTWSLTTDFLDSNGKLWLLAYMTANTNAGPIFYSKESDADLSRKPYVKVNFTYSGFIQDVPVNVDSFISSAYPTANFGLYSTIYINDNPSNRQRAVLEADIRAWIPSSATITGLTLYMFYYNYADSNPARYALYVKKLAQPFTETGVTWNTYDGNNNWPGGAGAMGDTVGDPVNIARGTVGYMGHKRWFLTPSFLDSNGKLRLLAYMTTNLSAAAIFYSRSPSSSSMPTHLKPFVRVTFEYPDGYFAQVSSASDSYISSANPTTNYGTSTTITVSDSSTDVRRGVLEFSVGSALPSGAIVDLMILYLYYYSGTATSQAIYVKELAQSFTETGVTWNTYNGTNNWPGGEGAMGDTVGDPVNIWGDTLTVGVGWRMWVLSPVFLDGNNNLRLLMYMTGGTTAYAQFYSKESSPTHIYVIVYYRVLSGEPEIEVTPTSLSSFYKEASGTATQYLQENTWYTSETSLSNPYFTLTNTGSVTVDVYIYSSNTWTGSGKTWTVSSTGMPGVSTIGLWAGAEGGSYSILIKPASAESYNLIADDLDVDSSVKFGIKIFTCTSGGGNVQMTGTIILSAEVSV